MNQRVIGSVGMTTISKGNENLTKTKLIGAAKAHKKDCSVYGSASLYRFLF